MPDDPLESWSDGAPKSALLNFIARVTKSTSPDYVRPAERIAVFDNDGTLWPEQPTYIQFAFTFDRVKALARDHAAWRTMEPFRTVLEGGAKTLAELGKDDLLEVIKSTNSGMTTDDFNAIVADWLAGAKDDRFDRLYTELVYQPMLELLAHLQANDFKVFVVSGAGQDFIRVFADKTYGIPPEQIIGSTSKTELQASAAGPVLLKLPKLERVDDGLGKPVAIDRFIGRRPIFAFGNSDGDMEMLEWTTAGGGLRFAAILHHTDAEREWAYDRASDVGCLDKALNQASERGWTIVDMKTDWNVIFPTDESPLCPDRAT
jgi:phosphoglycolate phosphatase-like HAD superfamily hydrolase